jgi:2-desacetyl-2-hydroxyethyl bacteriochlorophyllide A dehydrogenase
MKAALLTRPEAIEIAQVDEPEVGPADVLIEVRSCGVCATDVKKFTGASKAPFLPFILGHEPAGVVVRAGAEAAGRLQPGARVAVAPVFTCGACRPCRAGLTGSQGMGMCRDYRVLGYSMNGAFAERVVAPARHVHPIPEGLSFRDAALIEPVAACANGASRAAVSPPGTVVVIGAGFMGLVTLQLLRILGNRVLATDLAEERRGIARGLGADAVIDPAAEDAVRAVRDLTDGRGVEAVVCSVGGKKVTQDALGMLAPGGTLVLLGSAAGGTTFEVDLNRMHYDQTRVTGSVSYTGPGYAWAIDLLGRGMLDAQALITSQGPLEEVGDLLAQTRDLVGLKKIVLF